MLYILFFSFLFVKNILSMFCVEYLQVHRWNTLIFKRGCGMESKILLHWCIRCQIDSAAVNQVLFVHLFKLCSSTLLIHLWFHYVEMLPTLLFYKRAIVAGYNLIHRYTELVDLAVPNYTWYIYHQKLLLVLYIVFKVIWASYMIQVFGRWFFSDLLLFFFLFDLILFYTIVLYFFVSLISPLTPFLLSCIVFLLSGFIMLFASLLRFWILWEQFLSG